MEYKIIISDSLNTKEYTLTKNLYRIGRASINDIILKDDTFTISRFHCELERDKNGGYFLRDLGSKNGTFVNGIKTDKIHLNNGDIIIIGQYELKYIEKEEEKEKNKKDNGGAFTIVKDIRELENYWEKPKAKQSVLQILIQYAKKLLECNSIASILDSTSDFILKHLNPDRVFIFLKENGELELKHKKGLSSVEDNSISTSILEKAIKDKVSILSIDTMTDSRFSSSESILILGIKSAIVVPMFYEKNFFGAIYLDRIKNKKSFNEEELDFSSVISNYMSFAIQQFYLREKLEEEKSLRHRLERYHSPAVVNKILESKNLEDLFKFSKEYASVMFLDIVNFTKLTETLDPMEVGKLLNTFFGEITDIIFEYEGTLDKYIGDAIMAVFGTPFEIENPEEKSVKASLKILEKISEFNKNKSFPKIDVRIGINAGPVISGNFGSIRRVDFSSVGTTVNIASRLEEFVAKANEIVVSSTVYNKTKKKFKYEFLGEQRLKGVSKKIKTYKVIGEIK